MTRNELIKKFNVHVPSTSSYCMIHSYAKDAELPIAFQHYEHEHQRSTELIQEKEDIFCTLYIFMSGKFGFIFDNIICNPSYGDVVIVRDREKFTSCFYATSFMDYYEINFPVEFFSKISPINPFTKLFFPSKPPKRNLMVLDQLTREAIINILKKIDVLAKEDEFRDFLAYSYIIRIAELICEQQSQHPETFPQKKIPQSLKEALNYIHTHYTTLSGIDEVAAHCNITATYLARIFKKFLLCAPNEYITNLRISHAKYLLNTGKSITEVCYDSGFSNYTYFISKFKAATGTTPAKFKKMAETE